jgi:hypothetical protein
VIGGDVTTTPEADNNITLADLERSTNADSNLSASFYGVYCLRYLVYPLVASATSALADCEDLFVSGFGCFWSCLFSGLE